jgi:hypothetical protein
MARRGLPGLEPRNKYPYHCEVSTAACCAAFKRHLRPHKLNGVDCDGAVDHFPYLE